MKHIEEGQLQSYADGELNKSEIMTIDAHLRNCLSCSNTYKEIESLKQAISDSGLLQPSENFTQGVMRRISSIPLISPLTQKNDFLYKLPYLFAAALTGMVLLFVLLSDSDTRSASTLQEGLQKSLNETAIIGQYSLQVSEYGNKFLNLFLGNIFNATDTSSIYLMILFFAGSILIYQCIEYFQDRIRKHSQMMSLFV
ncbi:MAG: zf-HC2 domain-containing protein [Candidatus Marinimicrobia bacterium]|nr:zf-HC2 domain-containing protein [Candidatus Neomarinimicrobiota bacterium]